MTFEHRGTLQEWKGISMRALSGALIHLIPLAMLLFGFLFLFAGAVLPNETLTYTGIVLIVALMLLFLITKPEGALGE